MHFSEIIKFCKTCNTKLVLHNTRDIDRKNFCSKKCNGKYRGDLLVISHPEYYTNMVLLSNSDQHRFKKGVKGEKNKRYNSVKKQCLTCNQLFVANLYRLKEGCDKYCSKKCFYEWQTKYKTFKIRTARDKYLCRVCNKEFIKAACLRKHNVKYCSVKCGNIDKLKNMSHKDTSIEKKIETLLIKHGISYEKQKPIKTFTIADFFIAPNILIYADGDYWHSLSAAKARDTRNNKLLFELGYTVKRFSENAINKDIENVEKSLLQTLNTSCLQNP